MNYLINISYPKANKKQQANINDLFDNENFKNFIFRSGNDYKLIKPALFDHLEYQFFVNPAIKNKAQFSLLEVNDKNQARLVVDNCNLNSIEFNTILRTLRF